MRTIRASINSRPVLAAFVVIWFGLVIAPLLLLVVYSFLTMDGYTVAWTPSLETWVGLFESGRWSVTLRTLRFALTITLIELLLAFPFAYWLAKCCRSKTVKAIIITLLTIPFFLDVSSRTLVWRAILGNDGLLNTFLVGAHLVDAPVSWFLFSEFAVHFGALPLYFPNMLFPIFLSLSLVDDDLLQASRDLGSSPLFMMWTVVLPLALPGIFGGIVFTLVPVMAEYVVPHVMGGSMVNLIGKSIQSALTALRYPTAAALSAFIILLLVLLLLVFRLVALRRGSLDAVFRVLER